MSKIPLRQRYLESISSQVASLSLTNISKFYINYVRNNKAKVESELERVGYFVLKNKLSIGNSSTTTKDVFISTYFCNTDEEDRCNDMLYNKYHGDVDIRSTGGFFVPSTNELVVIVRIDMSEPIEYSVEDADIRSVVEHELTHAFDHTNKNDKLSKQRPTPSVGENFLSACAYLGCADRSEIASLMGFDMLTGGIISSCVYSISIVLYKLFTITEFNAHQMSDLEEVHKVDIKHSDAFKRALKKDMLDEVTITGKHVVNSTLIDADDNPELWSVVGKVLRYLGYNVSTSPSAVYKFFKRMADKLFKKYLEKKMKNQSKAVISLKEKNNIKDKWIKCITDNNISKGISFWFSPTGNRDSYLCRLSARNGNLVLSINNKPAKIYGNADAMMRRAVTAYANGNEDTLEFAVDNLVDVIVQSIERNFNSVGYDPIYDITEPQDEVQLNKSNKTANRFADLDWD
jgi:hypothetical protein